MKVDDICVNVIKILGNYLDSVEWDSIGYDADLAEQGMDSMIFIQMVVDIEAKFAIEIPDGYLLTEKMNTINKISDIVSEVLDGNI